MYNNDDNLLNTMSLMITPGISVIVDSGSHEYRNSQNRLEKLIQLCWKNGNWNQKLYDKLIKKNEYKYAVKYIARADEYIETVRKQYGG